jgi:hypothetical protein
MRKTVLLTALVISNVAFAGNNITADTNLAIGANTILANFKRVTEVPATETPNVDKSLAIGARSILGIFPRQTEVASTEKANVEASKTAFIKGVMNRTNDYYQQNPNRQATNEGKVNVN